MWVQFLDWEDPLKEEMATHYSILAIDRGAWRAMVQLAKSQTQLKQLSTHSPEHGLSEPTSFYTSL